MKKRKGQRKDGLIQVVLDIGHNPDGSRKRKSFYGHSRAEAERKRDLFKQYLNRGSMYSPGITVRMWVEEFKATYRQNVNSAYLDIDDVPYNRLTQKLGDVRMVDVTESMLQRALNDTSGMSFSTCDKYRQAIKRVFERARKNRIIADNPAEDLVLPPHTKGSHRALESWEVSLILDNWSIHNSGLWVMLMLLAGLRRSEMIGLDWSSVNMGARLIEVTQVAVVHRNASHIEQRAKTLAGTRQIPICQPLYDALSSIPASNRTGAVCLSAHGKRLTESAFSRGMETICNALERIANGDPPFQPGRRTDLMQEDAERIRFGFRAHDLRHTFATFLYDAGVNVKAAQYFLGHADIRITLDLYTHLSKEREAESRNQAVGYLDKLLDDRTKSTLLFDATQPQNDR